MIVLEVEDLWRDRQDLIKVGVDYLLAKNFELGQVFWHLDIVADLLDRECFFGLERWRGKRFIGD